MEKIRADVAAMLQAGRKAGTSFQPSSTDAAFNKLLKEQNQAADSKTKESAVSRKDSQEKAPDAGKENTKPVKESGVKEETDELQEAEVGNGMVPLELLLQLQESAGQFVMPSAEAAVGVSEQTEGVMEALSPPEIMVSEEANAIVETPLQSENLAEPEELSKVVSPETQATASEKKPVLQPEGKTPEKNLSKNELPKEARPVGPEMMEEKMKPLNSLNSSSSLESMSDEEGVKVEVPLETSEVKTDGDMGGKAGKEQQPAGVLEQPVRELSAREPVQIVSEPVRTSEPTMVKDLGHAIAQRFPESNGTLMIELEPASLGKLTIHVLYESGKATVSILSTNPRTLELLNAKATELAVILEEHTGQETIVYTEQPEREPLFDEREGERQQRGQEQENKEQKERSDQDSFLQQLRLGVI